MIWGPYRGRDEAAIRLGAYTDATLGPQTGILWTSGDYRFWLRRPTCGADGHYVSLLVRCSPSPPPPPLQPTAMQRIEDAFKQAASDALAHPFKTALMGAGMSPVAIDELDRWVVKPVDGFLNRHPAVKDGLVLVGDVAGVIAGVAVVIACGGIAGVVAAGVAAVATVVAGAACACLLVADGIHFWYAMRGDKASLLKVEQHPLYRWVEFIAPAFTLPDLALGGPGALRELSAAAKDSAGLGARAGRSAAASQSAEFNRRLTMAEDSSAEAYHQALLEAQKRAAAAQKMERLANAAHRKLLMQRDVAVSTAGGTWASRQYGNEWSELKDKAFYGVDEKGEVMHAKAERALGLPPGGAARPGTATHLLTPAAVPPGGRTDLHIMTMVHRKVGKG